VFFSARHVRWLFCDFLLDVESENNGFGLRAFCPRIQPSPDSLPTSSQLPFPLSLASAPQASRVTTRRSGTATVFHHG
jgi:hypothetical protein